MKRIIFLTVTVLFGLLILFFTGCPTAGKDSSVSDTAAVAGGYALRDTGPAGGLIFYINPNAASDGWTYLEAAPGDTGSAVWGGDGTVTGAQGVAIGTGKQNTAVIVALFGATEPYAGKTYGAKLCDDLTITKGGVIYDDWFMPSKDELDQMYLNLKRHGVGGFSDFYFWSSSESTNMLPKYYAWLQDFSYPPQYYYEYKSVASTIHVRACRRF